jgi:serine/threonine protein kinase
MSRYPDGAPISGKYRIVRLIGDGGMGTVYEARHEVLGSRVALKFLHADLAKRPGLTERFLQEARVSATIQSLHVTHVTDVDTAQDGSPYLVMELLSGEGLQAILDRQGKLPVVEAVDFALQILAGLEAAHAMGVVHRDLKPDNVFVTASSAGPLLKLIDFGIAKLRVSSEFTKGLTRAGVVMGTPEYMAPEQLLSAQTTDQRADIYSLGVMLFEMISGLRPADGDDAEIIVAAVESGRVRKLRDVAPGLPDGLVALIERATLPDREQRFESATAMRLALAPFAGPPSHAGRFGVEPHSALSASASAALLGLPANLPAPATSVPKTLPPDGPPLSVSQLGAARTSLSQGEPGQMMAQLPRPATGTALGGPAAYGSAAYAPTPYALPHQQPRPKNRSGLLVTALVLAVLGGGGAVGYAAYRAADNQRLVVPPLPDVDAGAVPTGAESVEKLTAENSLPTPTTTIPITKEPSGVRPQGTGGRPGAGASAGGSGTGPATGAGAGGSPTFPFPFPLPSGIQIPTALPSSIPLPPVITFPPGFPGFPPAAVPGAPAPTAPPATAPPATAPPVPAPAPRAPRPRQSSKP